MIRVFRGGGAEPTGIQTDAAAIETLNRHNGVSKQQAAAMLGGLMEGWQSPHANPDNYDSLGRQIDLRPITDWEP